MLCCLLVSLLVIQLGYAQSYFYFENRLTGPAGQSLHYYTFLTLQTDGSAVARIRHVTASGNDLWIEQQLTDSSRQGTAADNDPSKKYLVASGAPDYLAGTEEPTLVMPVFVLHKQAVEQDSLFMPESVEYLHGDKWVKADSIVQQEKTFGELTNDKALVSRFFNAGDDFYNYLFNIDTRALNNVEKAVRLYLIVVANTLDDSVGVSSKKDMDKMIQTFTDLKDQLGITMILKKIEGAGFSKTAVDAAINALKPAPADIVVFYYSGHGYRLATDTSKYPRISLRIGYELDIDKNNLGIEDIYKRILKKGARVNIVMSDCCNQDIDAPIPVGREPLRTRSTPGGKLNFDNCKKLFFPPRRISVLTAAAGKDQRAVGNPVLGGFFTNFFQAQLLSSLYTGTGTSLLVPLVIECQRERTLPGAHRIMYQQ